MEKGRLKSFFTTLKNQIKYNSIAWDCPHCSHKIQEYPKTEFNIMYDKQFHKYKYYFKCNRCQYVTPAFEKISDVINQLEYASWIQETELFDE